MKKFFAFLLCLCCVLSVVACSAPAEGTPSQTDDASLTGSVSVDTSTDTSTDRTSSTKPSTDTENKATSTEPVKPPVLATEPSETTNLAFVCDQLKRRVSVYDIEACSGDNLDLCRVWSYIPEHTGAIAGLKYREDTVFGDVIVIIGGQFAALVTYPEGKQLWKTNSAGNNGHCIEILPDGNIVTAASTGNTVRLFNTSKLVSDPKATVTMKEYELKDAHGVLWDPQYNVLWGLGLSQLVAFRVENPGPDASLVLEQGKGCSLPSQAGHALAADFLDKNFLWLSTGSAVYHFDKTTNRCTTKYDYSAALNSSNVKGFGNFPNGYFCYTNPNGGYGRKWASLDIAEWCTDRIYYFSPNEKGEWKKTACISNSGAFYKVVPFYGKYQ